MRAYTLGNESILVGVDPVGQVRDIYFPFVGRENHVAGRVHRVGVHADGKLRWLGHDSWRIVPHAEDSTMSGTIRATNNELGVMLELHDTVYNEKNIFFRKVTVTNMRSEERTVRVFFGHEFQVGETVRGDTAFYDPRCKSIIHYEGRRVFLINMQSEGGQSFDQYAVGINGIEGREGTHLDAEDGELSGNPIEHGQVDSVARHEVALKPNDSTTFYYWPAVGNSFDQAHELNAYVLAKSPAYLMGTAEDFWRAWLKSQDILTIGLSADVVKLFTTSLLVVRSHLDAHGSILASSDSGNLNQGRDTYAYMWPRDAAYAARALLLAGDLNGAKSFLTFCNSIVSDRGYFMHKYLPDGSVGSSWHPWIKDGKPELPIQADETAIVLIVLGEYYRMSRDVEFVESIFNSLIKRSADFLAEYVDESGLPLPSYDLWEQIYCTSTYTTGTTYAALLAAAELAHVLGKHDLAGEYTRVAERMQSAASTHLLGESGAFLKAVVADGTRYKSNTQLDFSSFYGAFEYGLAPAAGTRMRDALAAYKSDLELHAGTIGGMPRFTGDDYYITGPGALPNPWIITTLWLAQYYIRTATKSSDLKQADALIAWVCAHRSPSGLLSEQLNPYTGEPLGATPLVWSHAEFVTTCIEYIQKLQDLGLCVECYPLRRR